MQFRYSEDESRVTTPSEFVWLKASVIRLDWPFEKLNILYYLLCKWQTEKLDGNKIIQLPICKTNNRSSIWLVQTWSETLIKNDIELQICYTTNGMVMNKWTFACIKKTLAELCISFLCRCAGKTLTTLLHYKISPAFTKAFYM